MYIFEINLKNSPSATCHNKVRWGWGVCFVFVVCVVFFFLFKGGGVSGRKSQEVGG